MSLSIFFYFTRERSSAGYIDGNDLQIAPRNSLGSDTFLKCLELFSPPRGNFGKPDEKAVRAGDPPLAIVDGRTSLRIR